MTRISVFGWGTELRLTKLPPKLVRELTENGVSEERLLDIECSQWKHQRCWSGFEPDPSLFEITVDDKPIELEVLHCLNVDPSPPEIYSTGDAYLVCWESQKGSWSEIRTKKTFNPERVVLSAEKVILPDGSRYNFMNLEFDGESEFGGTVGKDRGFFVVSADGRRLDVSLMDEMTI